METSWNEFQRFEITRRNTRRKRRDGTAANLSAVSITAITALVLVIRRLVLLPFWVVSPAILADKSSSNLFSLRALYA
jgi:hypothetical protein